MVKFMTLLPVINLFPISSRAPNQRDLMLNDMAIKQGFPSKLVAVKSAMSPLDYAKQMADQRGNGALAIALEELLRINGNFKNILKNMPPISSMPFTQSYKYEHKTCDLDAANTEVKNILLRVSKGQVLFHGGVWPSGNIQIGQQIAINPILSTSWDAQVAAVHANYHLDQESFIWVITIENNNGIPAYVFDLDAPDLGQEKEVILAGISHVICTNIVKCEKFSVIEVSIY